MSCLVSCMMPDQVGIFSKLPQRAGDGIPGEDHTKLGNLGLFRPGYQLMMRNGHLSTWIFGSDVMAPAPRQGSPCTRRPGRFFYPRLCLGRFFPTVENCKSRVGGSAFPPADQPIASPKEETISPILSGIVGLFERFHETSITAVCKSRRLLLLPFFDAPSAGFLCLIFLGPFAGSSTSASISFSPELSAN